MTSFYRGGHQKVTLGDMGGGRGQKSQKRGDVLCERPLNKNYVFALLTFDKQIEMLFDDINLSPT